MIDAQRPAPVVAAVDAMSPKLDPDARIAPAATVVGKVSLHGAAIRPGTLVGMGVRALDGAQIGSRCLIAAATSGPGWFLAPDGVLIVGRPAEARRELDADDLQVLTETAAEYRSNVRRHRRVLNLHAPGTSGT